MKKQDQPITRRRFLAGTARSAGVIAVTAGVMEVAARQAGAASLGKEPNPFALDTERLRKTDPKLIRYEQAAKFPCPAPDSRRLALGPDDGVYIPAGNVLMVLDRAGTKLQQIDCSAPVRCVAVAPDRTIYAGVGDHVEVFDSKCKRIATWDAPAKKAWISGLALSESNVFAADSGSRLVLRYDKSGKVVGRIGEKNKDRGVPGIILPSPYLDVKLARDGLLRINNTGRHRVEAYTVDGDFEFAWGKPSGAIDGFCGCCNPVGLALLPDGRYVTCEKGLPRVKVYSPEGAFECVVAGVESFPENWRKCSLVDCTVGGVDAAVDSQQRIYILDRVTNDVRIMKRKA